MVHINGKDQNAVGMTIQEYLEKNEYPLQWIVVECNEEIVPKEEYATRKLADSDVVEIVSFVGGRA